MTIGQKIKEARKRIGMTGDALGAAVGLTKATISKIETDALLSPPTPETLIKIADALGDQSILIYALLNNPICQRIIPRAFAPLNNINDNTSAILAKLREELEEAIQSVDILSRDFSVKNPESIPAFKETLFAKLEQILDVTRCVEELFDRLKVCGVLTDEEHLEIHIRQQAKVEAHGHHKQAEVA
jgi:transcriptional regulator with XRE-family HTH domain